MTMTRYGAGEKNDKPDVLTPEDKEKQGEEEKKDEDGVAKESE